MLNKCCYHSNPWFAMFPLAEAFAHIAPWTGMSSPSLFSCSYLSLSVSTSLSWEAFQDIPHSPDPHPVSTWLSLPHHTEHGCIFPTDARLLHGLRALHQQWLLLFAHHLIPQHLAWGRFLSRHLLNMKDKLAASTTKKMGGEGGGEHSEWRYYYQNLSLSYLFKKIIVGFFFKWHNDMY